MNAPTKKTLAERLDAAASAKKAMLDKFRARPASDDPSVLARQEERKAISEAREARTAEREAARAAKAERDAAELIARETAAREQQAREAAEAAEREAALEIERKTQRDARYAARKARK